MKLIIIFLLCSLGVSGQTYEGHNGIPRKQGDAMTAEQKRFLDSITNSERRFWFPDVRVQGAHAKIEYSDSWDAKAMASNDTAWQLTILKKEVSMLRKHRNVLIDEVGLLTRVLTSIEWRDIKSPDLKKAIDDYMQNSPWKEYIHQHKN